MYSDNLKKLIFELRMSARELADKIGVSAGSIQNYEAHKREPNFEFIEKLHRDLNVNLNWFVSGKGEMFIKEEKSVVKIDKDEFRELFKECMKEYEYLNA